MSELVVTIGPHHSLQEAAQKMTERGVGAAVVIDPDSPGPGIVTERDVLKAVAAGEDCTSERVADHLTTNLTFATPDWSLEQAACAMVRGHFRHLIVIDGPHIVGMLSVRDILSRWTEDGAVCDVLPPVPEVTPAPAG
jgi:CBS domain-containing protein